MTSILKVALFLVLGASSRLLAAQDGVICGTVLNEAGNPAASTIVVAMYLSGPHTGPYDSVTTDSDGHYCVEHVRPGEYSMSADDPERGYPMLGNLFYALHAPEPRIKVPSGHSEQTANWQIPYKAGSLRVDATDKATGKPVLGTLIYLAVRGSEELRYTRGGGATISRSCSHRTSMSMSA